LLSTRAVYSLFQFIHIERGRADILQAYRSQRPTFNIETVQTSFEGHFRGHMAHLFFSQHFHVM